MSHVTMHLWRVPSRRVPLALLRMGLDRWHLRRTPGLRFAKLLGTGDGRTFSPRDADVRTWGLLCTWSDAAAADRFEADPTPRGWRRIAEEEWRADLACLRARGRWGGVEPFPVDGAHAGWTGPVAAVTRARLRPLRMRSFWRAVPSVVADLTTDGPLLQVGIGEAPIGVQGTLTVWPDAASLAAFAYRRPAHRTAIADTERQGWYAEELFARFAVLDQRGTVCGVGLRLTAPAGPPTGDADA